MNDQDDSASKLRTLDMLKKQDRSAEAKLLRTIYPNCSHAKCRKRTTHMTFKPNAGWCDEHAPADAHKVQ